MAQCNGCELDAEWLIYAAYDEEALTIKVHPLVSRYPLPMMKSCNHCLASLLTDDSEKPATTRQWIVKPARKPRS